MSDSCDQRTKLLAETLEGDWTEGPAAAMARRAAACARRRRTTRRTAAAVSVAAGLAALMFLSRPDPAPAPAVLAAQRAYEIISDDELATLLRNRTVLEIPRPNGTQIFVVLDR